MLTSRNRLTTLVAVLVFLTGSSLPLAAPQESQEPVVRVTTRLVVVNVVVQDKKGGPVEGLTREDFTVLDEGEAQPISLFAMEKAGASPVEPLPPDTFTNRVEYTSGGQKTVTVILLDFLNTSWQDRTYAKEQVVKFLQQLQPDDRVALYALGKDLTIMHNFTSDARPLLRALGRQRSADEGHVTGSIPDKADTGDAEMDALLDEQFQKMADFYVADRAARTADALVAIANHLAPFPGRKSLIWVSSSFPIHVGMDEMVMGSTRNRQTFTRDIERAARALNNANLAVYPVDARGLAVGMITPRMGPGRMGQPIRVFDNRRFNDSLETMHAMADRTGGRAFYNTNDIRGAIRQAIDDARVTYVLGYYPSHQKWDGKFRRIRVNVKQKDVRIRYRTGYFTLLPESQSVGKDERSQALREEAVRPLRSSGLGLTVQVTPVQTVGVTALRLRLRIDASQLTLAQQEDRWVGAIDVMFGQLREQGTKVHHQTQSVDLNLTQASFAEATGKGLYMTKLVELLPDAEELIVVARDVPHGNVGSVSIPLSQFRSSLEPSAAAKPR